MQQIFERKNDVIHACKSVYSAYLLLDFCSNPAYSAQNQAFKINNEKKTLKEFIVNQIKSAPIDSNEINQAFSLNGKNYQLILTKQPTGDWRVEIAGDPGVEENTAKPIDEYTPEDFIQLAQQHPLTIGQEESGAYKFGTEISVNDKKISIGGKEKIELYQLHIHNLYLILEILSSEEEVDPHMLIAMATGSGKSYSQALWCLVMYLSGISYIATVPKDSLTKQLKRDFQKLLPEELSNLINPDAPLPENNDAPFYSITTHEKLLKDFWPQLTHDEQFKNLWISFDEAHEVTEIELFKKRVELLTEYYPCMFLTATPSEKIYEWCHQNIISLSKRDKEERGISIASEIFSSAAKVASLGINALSEILDKLILIFMETIETLKSSASYTYVQKNETFFYFSKETDLFYKEPKPNPTEEDLVSELRWGVGCPISRKALVLVGPGKEQHDIVINLNNALHTSNNNQDWFHPTTDEAYPYTQGNRVPRSEAYNFFGLDDIDNKKFDQLIDSRKDFRREVFFNYIKSSHPDLSEFQINTIIDNYVDLSNTNDYLKYRIFHGIIANTLEFLTNWNEAQLDQARFEDLDGLMQVVNNKLNELPVNPDQLVELLKTHLAQNKTALPENVNDQIISAMIQVIYDLKDPNLTDQRKKAIVDNWSMDKQLHDYYNKVKSFTSLADQFKTVFFVEGLQETATAIKKGCPFYKLQEDKINVNKFEPKNPYQVHKLRTLEMVAGDNIDQVSYHPEECNLSPDQIDRMFSMGLIGAYITSERVTGFSDPKLHNLGIVLGRDDLLNEDPKQFIQGLGRVRGLNPYIKPMTIVTREEGDTLVFNPSDLDKKDYFPDLFKAGKRGQARRLKRLGKKISDEMQQYLSASLNPLGQIDPLKFQAKFREIILNEFESLYKENNHDYKKTSQQFCSVLEDTYQALYASKEQLHHSYDVTFTARLIVAVLSVISWFWYTIQSIGSKIELYIEIHRLENNSGRNSAELTYVHILKKYDYESLIQLGISAKRFIELLHKKSAENFQYITKDLQNLKPDIKDQLNHYFRKIFPKTIFQLSGITLQHKIALLNLIQKQEDWLGVLSEHSDTLINDIEENPRLYFELIQKIPEIKKYITNNNVIFLVNPLEETIEDVLDAVKDEVEQGQEITVSIKKQLEKFVAYIDPYQAQFFLDHKDQLNFSPDVAGKIQENLNLNDLVQILSDALPEDIRQSIPRIEDDNNQKEEAEKILWNLTQTPSLYFDEDKISQFMGNASSRFVESERYRLSIESILGPLTDEHLKTILSALYEKKEEVNKKFELISKYKKDLKEGITPQELYKKYHSLKDGVEIEDLDFYEFHKTLNDIYEELLDSVCYYNGMSKKGNVGIDRKPQLKRDNKFHSIWDIHATDGSYSFFANIDRKTRFMKSTLDSTSDLNQIEALNQKPLGDALIDTAEFVILPTINAMKSESSQPVDYKHLKEHQKTSLEMSIEAGTLISNGRPLSEEEIKSSETTVKSAVDTLRKQSILSENYTNLDQRFKKAIEMLQTIEAPHQESNIEALIALANTQKINTHEEMLELVNALDATCRFLKDKDVENYASAIQNAHAKLDSFPWFKLIVGILIAILALALFTVAAAFAASLFMTTGPALLIVSFTIALFQKIMTSILAVTALQVGVGAIGTVTGMSCFAAGAASFGFFGGSLIGSAASTPSFKQVMGKIKDTELEKQEEMLRV